MKKFNFYIAFICLISLLAGCQVMRGERTTKEYSQDAKITSTIKYRLAKNDQIAADRVHVETDKGVVLLSGFIKNKEQQRIAINIAKGVKGVKYVKSNMMTYKEAQRLKEVQPTRKRNR